MSKHNGNLDVYGILTVGAATSGSQYSFPSVIGNTGETMVSVDGDVIFTNVAPYIDISQTSGGNQLVANVNYLLNAIDTISGAFDTFVDSISASIGIGLNVAEKPIPIASAYLPTISGAELSHKTTAGGMVFDSLDFSSSEVAHFNFPMSENFITGNTAYLRLKMIANDVGTADFQVTFEDLSNLDDWTTSTGHTTLSFTHTFSGANVVEDEVITVTPPIYHDINPGDLVLITIKRVGGSLLSDASIISMKITW